jgi:predicted protein tyrosine phosphatase
MSQALKLLFLCSRNQRRSVTAESLFRGADVYEVKSAGTDPGATVRVKQPHVEWADIIFAMEHKHLQFVQAHFGKSLAGKRLICLEIPDKYGGMSLELVEVLRKRLRLYLHLPSPRQPRDSATASRGHATEHGHGPRKLEGSKEAHSAKPEP